MQTAKYKFSVVIPIYNAEKYLRETIESVLHQDIGFAQNIQIILVNDGSMDNSEKICFEYSKNYPENIRYIKQENAGVSAARNQGMKYAEGKYVNFLDSDDKWSPDAFSKVYEFFEAHYEEIDLVSCKQEFFEGKTGYHPLSRTKYDTDKVIDILHSYDSLQLHISASFVKAEKAGSLEFSTEMKYGEDGLYVSELILEKHQYGVVSQPTHYYRARVAGDSALQGKENSRDWYFVTPELFYKKLIKISMEKWGVVIPYVQYLIMYDLQWRLRDRIQLVLTEEERQNYIDIIKELLSYCADNIIVQQKNIFIGHKLFLFSLKYNCNAKEELQYVNGALYFHNILLYNFKDRGFFKVDKFQIEEDYLELGGQYESIFEDKVRFLLRDDENNYFPVETVASTHKTVEVWGETISHSCVFKLKLPLRNKCYYKLICQYDDAYPCYAKITYENLVKICSKYTSNYLEEKDYLVTTDRNTIYVQQKSEELLQQFEEAYCKEVEEFLRSNGEESEEYHCFKEALEYRKKYFEHRERKKGKIWLISEDAHISIADMKRRAGKDAKVYFITSEGTPKRWNLKLLGKILPYGSKKHKLYALLADVMISVAEEEEAVNPFYSEKEYMGNLFHYEYIVEGN